MRSSKVVYINHLNLKFLFFLFLFVPGIDANLYNMNSGTWTTATKSGRWRQRKRWKASKHSALKRGTSSTPRWTGWRSTLAAGRTDWAAGCRGTTSGWSRACRIRPSTWLTTPWLTCFSKAPSTVPSLRTISSLSMFLLSEIFHEIEQSIEMT